MSRPTARGRVGDFDENSPRPPVPGEETDPGYCCSNISAFSPPLAPYKYTPRSSSFHSSVNLEGNAPLGFEPEGSCTNNYGSCSPFYEGTRSPPPCLQWAKNMSCLLQDNEGVELFRRYLEREGQAHADALNFWFACEGLKKQSDKDLVAQLVKAIYKKFIMSPALAIREDLRREVTARIRDNYFEKGVFDSVQADVGNRIMKTTYPNFLKSDIYLNYVRQIPQDFSSSSGSGSGSGSSGSIGRDVGLCGGGGTFLQTLPEDAELVVSSDFLPLTRDALVATQSRRALEFRPKPEAFAGVYLQHGSQLSTRVYSSYNPVSRQDSELQSLSSDARTDSDAMSCTDNSVDGSSTCQYKIAKRQYQRQFKAMKESASMNRDNTHLLIPRTQRVKDWSCPMKPEELARQLIAKLEAFKREQEAQEKLDKKLMETECEPEKTFADMIREKLQMVDEQDSDNQAILDQHVSRVWKDTTPGGSPRLASPKPKSPDGRRKFMMTGGIPHPYQTKSPYCTKYSKKEKDVFSTFSADSGNVHDFTDISESSRHFPKSKSFPDYVDTPNSLSGYDGRARNNKEASSRRSSSKKVTSDLTDSGVSVISDTLPCGKHSTEWLIMRMKETCERTGSKHRSVKQPSALNSSGTHRHGRKSERSGSLERYPQQSYMTESAMPQLCNRPTTVSQLEEARRRLSEDEFRGKPGKQSRYPMSSKFPGVTAVPDLALSNSSTLRKSVRRNDALTVQRAPEQEYTTVMYSFWDEEVPYRTKVAGAHVTLKQFKDLLPRKGSYRYYFKAECAEVETKVIHEEIFDDNQELPLWEGESFHMGGGDSSQAHSSNTEKSKSKMSLGKLLTQRKAKVGCSKNKGTTVAVELPPRPVMSPTRNMFRGYCDPESRTTRLSLCCAMTESNSHTPPHSHPLALSPQMEKSSSSDEGAASMVVYTRDVATQTSFSPPARPRNETRPPEPDPIDDLYDDTKEYRNENFRSFSEFSLNRPMSYPSTPGKSTDEFVSSTTTSTSSGMSSVQAIPPRFSADNVMLSKSCARSGPDLAMYAPDYAEIYRRPTSQVIIRNRTVVAEPADNGENGASMDSLARQALLAAKVLHLIPADKARERNFLQRRTGANSLLGSVELERALPNREINVFVGTWNMNGHPPPRGINDFMLPQGLDHVPDIFAIGTQESYPEKFEWEVKIQETIGPSHVLYHSTSLGTIHLAIFIRRDLLWFCSIAEESSLSVRPGVAFKTKGAVAIGFILFGTSFLFITAHLTAHQERLKARIHDIKRIIRSLDLPKNLPLRLRSKSKDVTQNFDSVFWCGDLNFRLSQARDDVIHWVQGYKFPFVVDLGSDQLTKLITEGTCLSSFEEGQITFPPTYKYDPGTQNFDTSHKHRTPSYTDRILYKSRGGTVSCLAYYSVPRISTSDHKPVWGLYKGVVRPGIDTIPLTAGQFNREVYLEGIKRRAADMGRQKYGLSAVCCIQ